MRKSWRCRIGWHRYTWLIVSHTCEVWVCGCGRVVMQFADDPLALSEVEQLNAMWRQSEKHHGGR